MTKYKVFGREPALVLSIVAVLGQLVSQFFADFSAEQQGAVNAVAFAVLGLVGAWKVQREKLVPALLGFAQAGVALFLAFGVDFAADHQSTVLAVLTVIVGAFTRTQVTAPVDATGRAVSS